MDIEKMNKQKQDIEDNTLKMFWEYVEESIQVAYLKDEESITIGYNQLFIPAELPQDKDAPSYRNLKKSDLPKML